MVSRQTDYSQNKISTQQWERVARKRISNVLESAVGLFFAFCAGLLSLTTLFFLAVYLLGKPIFRALFSKGSDQ